MMFNETKSPFLSLGILGGSGAIITGLVQMIGYVITPADAADLSAALTGIVTSGAGVVAIVGRIRASKRISLIG
mgnify:CR=1 FL=1|tara:strand:- start:3375 stop:3596 length:222 start_codon:yes stop_codon:yes gene_type:complete